MMTEPYAVGPEAFVIQSYWQPPGAPLGVHMNSMVLRAAEPVLFDTSLAIEGEAWLDAVASVVDPADVRWIVLSHDDPDHTGNLARAMEACPQATVVSTWFMTQRLDAEVPVDPRRLRWVGPGEALDVGDRTLSFTRPPLFDSPTTRVIADPVSGVLWAADLFAAPVLAPTADVEALDPGFLAEGFCQFQHWNSPWISLVDPDKYRAAVAALAGQGCSAIASTHGPAWRGEAAVARAFELLAGVIDQPCPPEPGQPLLDEIVRQITAGPPPSAPAP